MSTHTATTRPTSITRRLALLALGLMVVLTGVGLGGSPASADAPNTPVKIIAKSYDDFIKLYWAPANISDPATSYRIERRVQSTDQWTKAWTVPTAKAFVDTTAEPNYTYVYRVRAQNADGNSAWSQDFIGKLDQSAPNEYYMFQSAESFVIRQYQDFLGVNPGGGPVSQLALNLKNGTLTASSLIDGLVHRPERAHRHQIIRLYNAYFDRTADVAGLHFWSDQITEHGKSINTVSNSFAASKEFKDMYGNLTNAQFVTLVYQNVLDRNPSPSDLAYWKGQLDQGKVTRGKVMTQFSESAEYKALSRGRVLSADVHEAMTGTAIGDATLATYGRHIQGGGTAGDFGTTIVLLNSYDAI
jgi:hypothetical protein